MKKLITALVLLNCQLSTANCQLSYWQQQVNYTIDVSLNDKKHELTGFEKIDYINNSPDTLTFIWFHIWPNAYKNDKTAFSDQLLENGNTKFYFSEKEQKGYINRLDFKVNEITAETEDHPQHIDIVTDPIESLIGSTIEILRAHVQASLVNREALAAVQDSNDVVAGHWLIKQAFNTDVSPILAEARRRKGGAVDPIAVYRSSGYRAQKLLERPGSGEITAGIV